MTRLRVLRIIEYQYASPEAAQEDMLRWTNTYRTPNGDVSFTSTTLPFSTIADEPEPNYDPIELCGYWDGPPEHVYGICNRPVGHPDRHAEYRNGELWAGWGGGEPPPAPRPSLAETP